MIQPVTQRALDETLIGLYAIRELVKRSFWEYLKIIDSQFYFEERIHLKELAIALEDIYYGRILKENGQPYTKIFISIPPQHGKSRTLVHFCEWCLGKDNEERIIVAGYNDTTASDFSRYVRDGIAVSKFDPNDIVFSDVFPDTKIKHGNSSFEKWALENQHFNYLGAGIGGSITSKGGTILIVDDPIKGAIEAYNPNYLAKVWQWYTGTFVSRVSADGGLPLEIIVMTRWSTDDLVGRILEDEETAKQWYRVAMKAYNEETDQMLCDDLLSRERYEYLKRVMDANIFSANYSQIPLQVHGGLYSQFKTYDKLPTDSNGNSLFTMIGAYCDTADKGNDYLCLIIFGVYQEMLYILDVLYTLDAMEVTEPEVAKRLHDFHVTRPKFESNSGGRGFARNVFRIYQELFKKRIYIDMFHQSKNKEARILSYSARVQQIVLMPKDWAIRWPKFFSALMLYVKEGKNAHDDAPDTLTGCVEMSDTPTKARAFKNVF